MTRQINVFTQEPLHTVFSYFGLYFLIIVVPLMSKFFKRLTYILFNTCIASTQINQTFFFKYKPMTYLEASKHKQILQFP